MLETDPEVCLVDCAWAPQQQVSPAGEFMAEFGLKAIYCLPRLLHLHRDSYTHLTEVCEN